MSKVIKHWFKHDFYASQNLKLQRLEFKYPIVGYGIFFKLIELLYRENGIMKYDLEFLSHHLNYDVEVIRTVIEDYDLFDYSDNTLANKRVAEGIEEITRKSNIGRMNAKKRWNSKDIHNMP